MMDRIVPAMDAEVSKTFSLFLNAKVVTILTGTKLRKSSKKMKTSYQGRRKRRYYRRIKLFFQSVVYQTSKELVRLSSRLDRGRIKVNEYMETSVLGIYAPGDINGTKMVAHAAFRMGEVAAENALKGNHHVAKLN